MKNIFSYKLEELGICLESIKEKKYRAKQIYEWLYQKKEYDVFKMSNISKEGQKTIANSFSFSMIKIIKKVETKDSIKYLFELFDKNVIEAVVMFQSYGVSLCVSSQVGCNMDCSFCESGKLKKKRNLEIDEMVQQVLVIESDIKKRIDSVVVMGIGEPFDNYDNVIDFVRIINNPFGLAIGARHITISTCGIIPKIKEFSELDLQVNLAVSLHAPNDALRNKLMPINKVYPLNDLIQELKYYIKKTNRRVTIEYLMLKGINDSDSCAQELISLIRGMNIYVNLIPYNETSNHSFKKSNNSTIMHFYDIMKQGKINITIRREFGRRVNAACGQLRAKEVE